MLRARKYSKHDQEYKVSYPLTKVGKNGTVNFQKGTVNDVVNIRRIKPYYPSSYKAESIICSGEQTHTQLDSDLITYHKIRMKMASAP